MKTFKTLQMIRMNLKNLYDLKLKNELDFVVCNNLLEEYLNIANKYNSAGHCESGEAIEIRQLIFKLKENLN